MIAHDQTPKLPASSQHAYNLHLMALTPLVGIHLPFEG